MYPNCSDNRELKRFIPRPLALGIGAVVRFVIVSDKHICQFIWCGILQLEEI